MHTSEPVLFYFYLCEKLESVRKFGYVSKLSQNGNTLATSVVRDVAPI